MAENLLINGVAYPGVESLEMTTTDGKKVLYFQGQPVEVVQDTGSDEAAVMSQKAVTNALNTLSNEKVDQKDAVLSIPQNLTEAQKAQARANIGAMAGDDIELAESLEWLNENGDTSKKYALPDGYIYAYSQETVVVKHNANDGKAQLNARTNATAALITNSDGTFSSPATTVSAAGNLLTGVIELKNKANPYKVNISGISELVTNFYASLYVHYYKSDGTCLGYLANNSLGLTSAAEANVTLPVTVNIATGSYWSDAAYVVLTLGIKPQNTSISSADVENLTINFEPLNTEETIYGWYSTGQQHSTAKIDRAVLFTAQTLTEAQKAQARANIGASAGEDVEFAESIEWLTENGDTAKKYVLPDGYIYTWQYKKETIEHNANDGTGVINKAPASIWGNDLPTAAGVWTSPVIHIDPTVMAPVDARNDTVITISGLDKIVPVYNNASIWTFYYRATGAQMFAQNGANMGGIGTNSEITLPLSYQLKNGNHFLDSNWAEVAGVRICIGVSTAGAITADDIKNLKVNIPFFNKEIDGYGWYSTGLQHSNDKATQQNSADIATLKEEVATLKKAVSTSPSNSGAVWYAIGDSITYGLYSTSATDYHQPVVGQRWVDYVAKHNGYELTNLGVSGSGFVTGTTFRTVVDRNDFSEVDLVTILLGVNDWKNEEAVNKVGTFDDDVTIGGTIVSEFRYGLEKIIADNPYCKIIFITPPNVKIGSRGTEETNWAYGYSGSLTPCGSLKNFCDKLKEVCEYYGIQVIDMTNSSVVNRKSITTTLPDGIHPNLDTYRVLGLELARRITFA